MVSCTKFSIDFKLGNCFAYNEFVDEFEDEAVITCGVYVWDILVLIIGRGRCIWWRWSLPIRDTICRALYVVWYHTRCGVLPHCDTVILDYYSDRRAGGAGLHTVIFDDTAVQLFGLIRDTVNPQIFGIVCTLYMDMGYTVCRYVSLSMRVRVPCIWHLRGVQCVVLCNVNDHGCVRLLSPPKVGLVGGRASCCGSFYRPLVLRLCLSAALALVVVALAGWVAAVPAVASASA